MIGERINQVFTEKWAYGEMPTIQLPLEKVECSKLVTLGNCFARNFTRCCIHYGYVMHDQPWDVLYNPFSVDAEIKRIFEPIDWSANIIMEFDPSDGRQGYRDPWRTWYRADTERALEEKNKEIDILAKECFSNASGFLITFGLSEVWSPRNDPTIVLNRVPIEAMACGYDLWESRLASVSEVTYAMLSIINTIRT